MTHIFSWKRYQPDVVMKLPESLLSCHYIGGMQIFLREAVGLQSVAQLLKLRKGSADGFTEQKVIIDQLCSRYCILAGCYAVLFDKKPISLYIQVGEL